MLFRWGWLAIIFSMLLLSGCGSTKSYHYEYRKGRTATVNNGVATAPPRAPRTVHEAIAAGNRIAGRSYQRGGGHGQSESQGYDCSGAVSYVLSSAGLMRGSTTSQGFRKFGKKGSGKWITVYAKSGHVFLVVAGLRFDTGWTGGQEGPQWTTKSRPAKGYVERHPSGL